MRLVKTDDFRNDVQPVLWAAGTAQSYVELDQKDKKNCLTSPATSDMLRMAEGYRVGGGGGGQEESELWQARQLTAPFAQLYDVIQVQIHHSSQGQDIMIGIYKTWYIGQVNLALGTLLGIEGIYEQECSVGCRENANMRGTLSTLRFY